MAEEPQGIPIRDIPPGTVTDYGDYVVGNVNGQYFALTRWCGHRRGDLAHGTIDEQGCLVCPVHGARYDVGSGRTLSGPTFTGGRAIKRLMNLRPLRRGTVEVRCNILYVR